jgi:hypothetical protein
MPKSKSQAGAGKPAPKNPPAEAEAESPEPLDEITPTALGAEDWALIEKANTFLFHVQAYAARARLHGYDDEEHAYGIALVAKASGRDRPLSHWIEEGKQVGESVQFTGEQLRLLQEIDAFENAWFPRVRGILQRALPAERYEPFHAAFFKDLKQQPLGPAVVDSVSTLLDRFDALAKSDEPGAKEAHKLGVKRGLTKDKVADTRALLQKAKKNVTVAPKAAISAGDLAQAKKEQLTAVAELRRWYNDWGATFRTVFGQRVLIRLGLATLKRSPADGDDEDEENGNGGGGAP